MFSYGLKSHEKRKIRNYCKYSLRGVKAMKRKFLILSVLAIMVAILAANTLAYFTADTKAHNVITSGGVDIELKEWANEDRTEPFENRTGVMPGTEVTKIAEVTNTGTAPVWVRVQVTLDVYAADESQLSPEYVTIDFNETDWTYFEWYYYYNRALAPGETTEPLFTTVTFAPTMGNEYQNSTAYVEVKAGAVQSDNNGTDALSAAGWPSFAPPEPTVAPLPPENP